MTEASETYFAESSFVLQPNYNLAHTNCVTYYCNIASHCILTNLDLSAVFLA